jgi:hypothetical protein
MMVNQTFFNIICQLLYIHVFDGILMKKINIAMAIIVISIFGVIINSASFLIPDIQATSEESNNEEASDDDNKVSTFGGDLGPSTNTEMQIEQSPPKTIVQSDNLQNPSIQESLQQQQQ